MASVVVGPRVEFDPDHYPRIRFWDPSEQRDWYVYLHRLTEFAQGNLDSPFQDTEFPVADLYADGSTEYLGTDPDSKHVHHKDCDGWNNNPRNLEAVSVHEHIKHEKQVANLQ